MRNIILVSITLLLLVIACSPKQERESQEIADFEYPNYASLGDSISLIAQQTLVKALLQQIQSGGAVHAITFCSEKASVLTDSLFKIYDCGIRRVAKKNRNPENELNESEIQIFSEYEMQLANKEKLTPKVIHQENEILYYKPIILGMQQCLSCHGNLDTIEDGVKNILAEKYPNDKAIGFKEGDLRGMWKLIFKKQFDSHKWLR